MSEDLHRDEVEALGALRELSNQGRWGADDERGALNLVTPEHVRRAARLVRHGRIYALGEVIGPDAPAILGRPEHSVSVDHLGRLFVEPVQTATDGLNLPFIHGSVTHVDALCHIGGFDRKLYNGFAEAEVTERGAERLGIENVPGLVTRGVLLDVAGLKGVDALAPGDVVTAADLVAAADAGGVAVAPGDAVLVRTGYRRVAALDPERYAAFQPGIGPSAALHLAACDVCLIGADTIAVEAMNIGPDAPDDARAVAGMTNRLHPHLLRHLGLYLLELLNLDELAAAGVAEFQFCMAPLLIAGGTSSPVNPLAVC